MRVYPHVFFELTPRENGLAIKLYQCVSENLALGLLRCLATSENAPKWAIRSKPLGSWSLHQKKLGYKFLQCFM